MNWLNLTHVFTNTQVMPPRKQKWSLKKLTFTLLQNQKYLKRIPTGHHPYMVKGVSHRPSRQPYRPKPQLKKSFHRQTHMHCLHSSCQGSCSWVSHLLSSTKSSSAPTRLERRHQEYGFLSPAKLGEQLIWYLLYFLELQQRRYLWL